MDRPKIGLTVPERGQRRFKEYLQRIDGAGGDAIEITPDDRRLPTVGLVDGLLLPGGVDIDPARYGAEAHPETTGVQTELDELEIEFALSLHSKSRPILAICRGHQLINVAFGGSLHQHIDSGAHRGEAGGRPISSWHEVQIEPESRLAKLLGVTELTVNSRHHQAVTRQGLAGHLQAVAFSADGYVEGIEPADGSWLVAVQWHPEREEVISSNHRLFEGFVDAVANAPFHFSVFLLP